MFEKIFYTRNNETKLIPKITNISIEEATPSQKEPKIMRKQTLLPPKNKINEEYGYTTYSCGHFKKAIHKLWLYCPYCGQKIKWEK